MPVHIRKRWISRGKVSLYADKGTKQERFKSLDLYLLPGNDKYTKQRNKQALQLAEKKSAQIEREMAMPDVYSPDELSRLKLQESGEVGVFSFISTHARKKKESNYNVWMATLKHLSKCWGGREKKFRDITLLDIDEFQDYLLNTAICERTRKRISHNSAACYFATLKSILTDAARGGMLPENIISKMGSITPKMKNREYLDLAELKKLKQAKCPLDWLKRISFISAYTGARWVDIVNLKAESVVCNSGQNYLSFKQQKTGDDNLIPISNEVLNLLPYTPPEGKIFPDADYDKMRPALAEWIKNAGINKRITFHSFRHSNAMVLLANGADIVTVSSLLGHSSLKTTQIYAKALDENKIAASKLISI